MGTKEDDKHAYEQIEAFDLLCRDKEKIEQWIDFHVYNGPDPSLKRHVAKQLWKSIQIQFEEMLYDFYERLEKL